MIRFAGLLAASFLLAPEWTSAQETLPPLVDGKAPQTHAELWAGYDPRKEPLETEILHEWEEDGVVLRVVRFRVGIFKGQKSMIAGVYGYPKGGKDLPGLLNIHGGGQYADYKSCLTNAKRGYATFTMAWAGRISAPNYRVSPAEVKLFWDGKTDDPKYKVTTDWGALDAYHAPSRNGKDAFPSMPESDDAWLLDQGVLSPRNNSWFLCALAGRRALTFLEQQPEVNGDKLGVYGHSMGGKLTVAVTGADNRVKAAAPSCGGTSDRYNDLTLHQNTVGDSPALKNIQCPTFFLYPANDFHGRVNDLPVSVKELGDNDWRITSSAHLNHRDYPQNEVATQLWFDQYLKGTFAVPKTPEQTINLQTESGVPVVTINPDTSREIVGVDVYYTLQGKEGGDRALINHYKARFWHHAQATEVNGEWTADLPVADLNQNLWVYANVDYAIDEPVSGAGYYYGNYTAETFTLSSLIEFIRPDALKAAGVKATLTPSLEIESFQGDWRKAWYSHKLDSWEARTHKVYSPLWKAPEDAVLVFAVKSEQP
ncbi:MAG: dienelactone hydrolase family protein, partial [Verrucomicrobiota bacterium]